MATTASTGPADRGPGLAGDVHLVGHVLGRADREDVANIWDGGDDGGQDGTGADD